MIRYRTSLAGWSMQLRTYFLSPFELTIFGEEYLWPPTKKIESDYSSTSPRTD